MSNEDLLERFKKKWRLIQYGEALEKDNSVVAFVHRDGVASVLKIFNDHSDEYRSAAVLQHYDSYGAVKVIKQHKKGVLLECGMPGSLLKDIAVKGKDEKATEVFCYITKKLHNDKEVPEGFPLISYWGKWFDIYLKSDYTQIPMATIVEARRIFLELNRSQGKLRLLHGDLHHENILYDKKRGWLAFDPKGIIGEAEVEAAPFIKNPVSNPELYTNKDILQNRIDTIVERLDLNRERVILWSYTLAMTHCIWLLGKKKNPSEWLKMCEILRNMV